MLTIALLLATILPQPVAALREYTPAIEVNEVYDSCGRLVLTQTIYRDHDNIRDWRLLKTEDQVPQRDWRYGGYVAVWWDGEVFREVRCRSLTETSSNYDVELSERERLPVELRKKLRTKQGT